MTPQEKADELVHKFKPYVQFKMGVEQSYVTRMAKQCALVAVDFAKENPLNSDGYNKYLEEVKQEIECQI